MIAADEYNVVCDMQVIDREVFFYLVQRVDSRGIVGVRCRVSYGGMALDLSERTRPGPQRELITFNSKQIENSVERLVKVGLFNRLSESGRGKDLLLHRVFSAGLASADRSDQNEFRIYQGFNRDIDKSDNVNKNNNLNCSEQGNNGLIRGEFRTTNIQHHHQQKSDDSFQMSMDWVPDDQMIKMILFRSFGSRFKITDINPAWITEFMMYWSGRNERHTSAQWMHKLGKLLIIYLNIPGEFERRNGVFESGSGRGKTHMERNSSALPDWARPPRNDSALCGWMRKFGYGDGPAGVSVEQTRGWLRRQIDDRLSKNNLPKIAH